MMYNAVEIRDQEHLNPLEVILVADDMARKGIKHYTMARGNDCIWVYYGQMNLYYIFRDGKLVDIQID
jgi:hypothetical protein